MQAMMLNISSPPSLSSLPKPIHFHSSTLSFPCFRKFKGNLKTGSVVLPSRCIPGQNRDAEKSEDDEKMPVPSSSPSSLDISTYNWCAGLAGLGFLETSYLTYIKLSNTEPFCPVGGGSCGDVLNSDYAEVLGVPLPLIGMTAYGFIFLLGLELRGWNFPFKISHSDGRILLLSVCASMAAASGYFLYILSTRFEGASCSYCFASAMLSFSLFFIILKDFGVQEIQKVAALPLCTAAIVLGVLSTAYSSVPPTMSRSAAMELPYYTTEIITESSPFAISLARHLKSIGARMYGAFWCSHCQEQKQTFGREAAKLLDYVECFPGGVKKGVKMVPACTEVGIEGFPTWVINGEVLGGEKTLEELAEISGFHNDIIDKPN